DSRADELIKRPAIHILHDEIVQLTLGPNVINLNDVRVDELGGGPCFALKAKNLFGRSVPAGDHHLHGNQPLQAWLAALIDNAHCSSAEPPQHLVLADAFWQILLRNRGDGGISPRNETAPQRSVRSREGAFVAAHDRSLTAGQPS